MIRIRWALVLAALAAPAFADAVRIGHLSLTKDPRYVQDWGYARLIAPPPVITSDAARIAVTDLQFTTDAADLTVTLDARAVAEAELAATAQQMVATGDSYLVLDLLVPM